jgi:hypothetical protein
MRNDNAEIKRCKYISIIFPMFVCVFFIISPTPAERFRIKLDGREIY